ncbi:MAG: hypothetical protein AAGL49_13735, partial [Pseudomonadota bacterium]
RVEAREALAAELSGWAFKVSAFQYDRIAPPLEDLLAPPSGTGRGGGRRGARRRSRSRRR